MSIQRFLVFVGVLEPIPWEHGETALLNQHQHSLGFVDLKDDYILNIQLGHEIISSAVIL
jgi:hypothetical protein